MSSQLSLIKPENKAISVFGGSKDGNDSAYIDSAKEIGRQLYKYGVRNLLYGGTKSGVMGAFSTEFKNCGGTVIEIIDTGFLSVDRAYGNESHGITDHRVVPTSLQARKNLLLTGSDGLKDVVLDRTDTSQEALDYFSKIKVIGAVALPGGIGTYDEILDVFAENQRRSIMQSSRKEPYDGPFLPIALINTNGVYDMLSEVITHSIDRGFANPKDRRYFTITDNPEAAVVHLVKSANAREDGSSLAMQAAVGMKIAAR